MQKKKEQKVPHNHLEKHGFIVAALRTDDVTRSLKSGVLCKSRRDTVMHLRITHLG